MVTVSLPSLVPPKGTGEAPALSPPSGASPPAHYNQQAVPTLRPKKESPGAEGATGALFEGQEVTVVSAAATSHQALRAPNARDACDARHARVDWVDCLQSAWLHLKRALPWLISQELPRAGSRLLAEQPIPCLLKPNAGDPPRLLRNEPLRSQPNSKLRWGMGTSIGHALQLSPSLHFRGAASDAVVTSAKFGAWRTKAPR